MVDEFYHKEYLKKKKAGKASPEYLAEMKFLSQIDGLYKKKNKEVKQYIDFFRNVRDEMTETYALKITINKAMAWAFSEIIHFVNKKHPHKKTQAKS